VLDAAVDRALARIRQGGHKDLDRRTQIERELSLIGSKMERLLDALAEGKAPKDEIVARMTAEKSRKTALVGELAGLERRTSVASLDPSRLKRDLRARVADVKTLLGRHPQQARQMLRKLLTGKIKMDPIAEAGRRGYRFRGNLSIGRLLSGEALQPGTREILVTPGGSDHRWPFSIDVLALAA
jgi:hypothetical protein